MSDDLVKRLRRFQNRWLGWSDARGEASNLFGEAAARIAALEEGLRDLRQMIADGAEDADPLLVIDALLGGSNG